MKKLFILPILLCVAGVASYAQPQPTGNLTVFSDDGFKFYLILNGERQNNEPQTNLRVEDLTQDYYSAKVIFEDKSLGEIEKKFLPITDANGIKQDVTYKIKQNKNNGKVSLNYYSATPVVQGFVPPSNVYVVRSGQPAPPVPPVQTTVVVPAQTTVTRTTTTTVPGGNTIGTDVTIGGINMNVHVTDPTLTTTQTTVTRTTTTTTDGYHEHPHVNEPRKPAGCRGAYPMSSSDFSSALNTIKNQGFDETRLKTAKQIASGNCLSPNQISDICKTFGFEQSKLDFAKYAYTYCTEPNNYFKINNVFGFSSSVDELTDYISGNK